MNGLECRVSSKKDLEVLTFMCKELMICFYIVIVIQHVNYSCYNNDKD